MFAQGFFLAGLVAAAIAGHATYYAGGLGHGHEYGLGHGLSGAHGGGYGGSYSFGHGGNYGGSHGGSYGGSYGEHGHQVVDYHSPAHYDFHYGVEDHHTGDKKQQSESRHGDVTHSGYSLAEHDRSIHVAKYSSGDHAVVHSVGYAAHPHIAPEHSHHGLGHGAHGHGY